MGDTDAVNTEQIRSMSSSAPRPPFAGQQSQQMRPQMGPPTAGSASQRQAGPQGQAVNNQQRPIPPPLRRVDSKGNAIVNPGQQPPRLPQQPNQQVRPQSGGGSLSPPGHGPQRPQGSFQWPGPPGGQPNPQNPQNRPPNTFGNPPLNQAGRPYPRPSVGPGGQPQFRPPYPQQNLQHQQQQQQLQQQQQYQGPPFHPQPQQRTLGPPVSAQLTNSNHDDDDNDVVFGQAVTPLKTPTIAPSAVRNDQISNENKTILQVATHAENNVPPKSTSFGDLNGKEHLKDIVEEVPLTSNDQIDRSKMNEPVFAASEPSSHSTKLTNFQKISGDVTEKTIKTDKPPLKQRESDKPKEPMFSKDIKGDNDSGVDESTQEKERNGPTSPSSPAKTPTKSTSGISRPPSATPSNKSNKSRSTSRSRLALKTPEPDSTKKVPMNKVQVGNAPSPNLKAVRSKIGSLDNATYKPGGGKVKIESKKIEIKAAPRIEAKNEKYTPKGGDKKIVSTKLQWNAKSKIGSLENANHKPGGGDKKIDTIKADFKDKAKPKVGSKDNVKYAPGGGDIKKDDSPKDIQTHKIEVKAQSKVGSLDNVKHKPGGGDKKIYDDKDYLKNVEHPVALNSPSQSPPPSSMTTSTIGADENLNQQQQQQQQPQPA